MLLAGLLVPLVSSSSSFIIIYIDGFPNGNFLHGTRVVYLLLTQKLGNASLDVSGPFSVDSMFLSLIHI